MIIFIFISSFFHIALQVVVTCYVCCTHKISPQSWRRRKLNCENYSCERRNFRFFRESRRLIYSCYAGSAATARRRDQAPWWRPPRSSRDDQPVFDGTGVDQPEHAESWQQQRRGEACLPEEAWALQTVHWSGQVLQGKYFSTSTCDYQSAFQVLAHSAHLGMLLVSQPNNTTSNLFPGFGVRRWEKGSNRFELLQFYPV